MDRAKCILLLPSALALMLFMQVSPLMAQKQQEQRLYVLGTENAVNLAKDFLNFLNNEGISTVTVTGQFEQFLKERYIVILGGPNEPGGLGDLVRKILTSDEQREAGQPGKGKMYVKENVFTPGQAIIIFAGGDAQTSAEVRKKTRTMWMPVIGKWFDVDFAEMLAY